MSSREISPQNETCLIIYSNGFLFSAEHRQYILGTFSLTYLITCQSHILPQNLNIYVLHKNESHNSFIIFGWTISLQIYIWSITSVFEDWE